MGWFLLRPYLEVHKFIIRMDHVVLKCILNGADATGKLERWRLRFSEFELDVESKAGIKNQTGDAIAWLEIAGMDTTDLDDDLPKMVVSLIDHSVNINDHHDGSPNLLCICQHFDDTVDTINNALPEVSAIAHAIMKHMTVEEAQTLGAVLQAQASNLEWEAAAQTIRFPASLFTYDRNRS